MMTRINSITVSPFRQHRGTLGAIEEIAAIVDPPAELMEHGPAALPGRAPFRIGMELTK